jgi:tetratricopeptide (TPR) repeat protein
MLAHHFHCKKIANRKIGVAGFADSSALTRIKAIAERQSINLSPLPGIRLSACLIVRDEEKHLAKCLESIRGVVDEIVIVDTGSSDNTLAIADQFGATIGHFDWSDDFSAARNHALSLSKGNWVLWIDADERLSTNANGAILAALVRPHFGGYTTPIINYLGETEAESQFQHRPCRLFQRLAGIEFSGRVHEQIAPSILALGLPIAQLEGVVIHHYGYQSADVANKNKRTSNFELIRAELNQNPNDAFQWFNLANAHFEAGEWELAVDAFQKAQVGIEPGIYHGQFLFQSWAIALQQLGRIEEALRVCDMAERRGFSGQLVEFARAHILLESGKPELALPHAEIALKTPLGDTETGDNSIGKYKAKHLRGRIFSALGMSHEAILSFSEVCEIAPGFEPALIALAAEQHRAEDFIGAIESAAKVSPTSEHYELASHIVCDCKFRLGKVDEAIAHARGAYESSPSSRSLWLNWIASAERAEDWRSASEAYAAGSEKFEFDSGLMINAGRAFQRIGRRQAALEIFEQAIELDPTCANAYFNVGDLFMESEKYREAAAAYSKGLESDFRNADGWLAFGNALFRCGAVEGAAQAYRQALDIRPEFQAAIVNLAAADEELGKLAA